MKSRKRESTYASACASLLMNPARSYATSARRNAGATFDQIAEAGIVISSNATFPMDALQIAKQPVPDRPDLEFPLYFRGEGHLLTVAPHGRGQGVSG